MNLDLVEINIFLSISHPPIMSTFDLHTSLKKYKIARCGDDTNLFVIIEFGVEPYVYILLCGSEFIGADTKQYLTNVASPNRFNRNSHQQIV